MPRFGKDKNARNEELDRQAAEEVDRLTRRGGVPGGGMPGMGGPGGPPIGIPSPLEQMAAEVADAPRPSQRRAQPRRPAPQQQQAFTPLPSGGVGSSFGPGGLNPGPRMAGAAPPPPAFGGGDYNDDHGGPVSGPPVFHAEPDEDEEMTITEMALMDHAARTGFDPEDLVIRYDASAAEEMRDAAMRQFYERQQARRPGAGTNNPFAPAGMRSGPAGAAPLRRNDDPKAAGGALAQRLANRRRREEEEARRARAEAEPAPAASSPSPSPSPTASASAAPTARSEPVADEGALAKVLARRRRALGIDDTGDPTPQAEPEPVPEAPEARETPGPRHARARAETSPGLRSVPLEPVVDESAPSLEDMAATTPTRRGRKAASATAKAPAAKKTAKAPAAKRATKAAPAAKVAPPATAAPAAKTAKAAKATKPAKATKAVKGKKAGATLAKAPAAKAPATKKTGKAKTVFCIECGEKNPAIAKFCFSCGTRLAAPEN